MKELKELEGKEVLTIEEYGEISAKLSHLLDECEKKDREYTLSDIDLKNFISIRDTVDEFEIILGTNYKEKYTYNLECLDVFLERKKDGKPNNESWEKFRRNS